MEKKRKIERTRERERRKMRRKRRKMSIIRDASLEYPNRAPP